MTSYYSATPRPERPKAFSYYAQEVRRRNRALRDELRGADVEGILNLAARRGQGWDTVSVSTALHAFACKVKQKLGPWWLCFFSSFFFSFFSLRN